MFGIIKVKAAEEGFLLRTGPLSKDGQGSAVHGWLLCDADWHQRIITSEQNSFSGF